MVSNKKIISIMTQCYNEQENIKGVYRAIKEISKNLKNYQFEHLFIDNNSNDDSKIILEEIANKDKSVKVIFNTRNFGQIRSGIHALLQTSGSAVIVLDSDLQDPVELIYEFIKYWENGYKIVIGIKSDQNENIIMKSIRRFYYSLIKKFANIDHIPNFTSFGLYDREFIEIIREIKDPYPYFRGLVSEIGLERKEISYYKGKRIKGYSKSNFYTLFETALQGFCNYSMVPLRLATFSGFMIGFLSIIIAFIYLLWKIIYWNEFQMGIAPIVIATFFFGSVQLIFIGILGEYLGAIFTQVKNRPYVIERKRINFDS